MLKSVFCAVLILAPMVPQAVGAEVPVPKVSEIGQWFKMSGVRWTIYQEYIQPYDFAQTTSLTRWATKKGDATKPGFAKAQVAYLAAAMKDAARFESDWAEGMKEVLRVPTLTREEADKILGYMIDRREAARVFGVEVTTAWRVDHPASVKVK